jgi:hypothetical protein
LQKAHAVLCNKKPKARSGFHSHWLFAIRGVLLHRLWKEAHGFNDEYLICAVAFCFAHATQMLLNPGKETMATIDEYEETEAVVEQRVDVLPKVTKPKSGHTSSAKRVFKHLLKASYETVLADPTLNDAFADDIEFMIDKLKVL